MVSTKRYFQNEQFVPKGIFKMSSFFIISHLSYDWIQRKFQGIIPIIGLAHSMLPEQYVHKPYKTGLWSGWELFTQSAISPVRIVPTNHISFLFIPKPKSYIFGDFPKSYLITVAQEEFRLCLWSIVLDPRGKPLFLGRRLVHAPGSPQLNVISKHFWKLYFHLLLPYNRLEYKPSLWHQEHLL